MPVRLRDGTLPQPASPIRLRGGRGLVPLPPEDQPGLLEALGGGAFTGLSRHPIFGPAADKIADQFGFTEERRQALEQRLSGSTAADVGELIGEFGPDIAAGMGMFGLGARAGVALTRGATSLLAQQAGRVAGSSAAVGSYDFVRELIRTEDVYQAAKHGAISAALVGGTEAALTGGARLLSRRARRPSPEVEAELRARPEFQKMLKGLDTEIDQAMKGYPKVNKKGVTQLRGGVVQRKDAVQRALRTADQEYELISKQTMATLRPQEAFERMEAQAEKVGEKLVKLRQAVSHHVARRTDKQLVLARPHAWYTYGTPFNPEGVRLALAKMYQQVAKAPEAMQGEQGVAFAAAFNKIRNAEGWHVFDEDIYTAKVLNWFGEVKDAMGFGRRQIRRAVKAGRDPFLDLEHAWSSGGEAGVTSYMRTLRRSPADTQRVLKVLNEADTAMKAEHRRNWLLGAQDAADLPKLGLAKYWPQMFANLSEEEIQRRLAKELGEDVVARLFEAGEKAGYVKFGSLDHMRAIPGTLKEKIERGLPFEQNMFEGLLQYLNRSSRRYHYAKEFGWDADKAKAAILGAVRKEGGSVPLVNSTLDIALGHNYHSQGLRELAKIITGLESGSKLALAVIPNMSQSINTVLDQGVFATLRGAWLATKPYHRDEILKGIALQNTVARAPSRIFGAGEIRGQLGEASSMAGVASDRAANRALVHIANAADLSAYYALKLSGFRMVERWNRVLGGSAGLVRFRTDLQRAYHGRLRGQAFSNAERSWRDLGFDFKATVERAKRAGDDFFASKELAEIEKQFTFRAAQRSQFIPSGTRRPLFWNHPVGRVVFQFKNFGLNQGRFLRDRVLVEAAHGNFKPLAYFASIYPIAGEFVTNAKSLVKDQELAESDGVSRLLGDYMAVGGFGTLGSTVLQMRAQRGAEDLLGPFFSDALGFAENVARMDAWGLIRQAERQPVWQAIEFLATAGLVTAAAGFKAVEDLGDDEEASGRATVDFGDLRRLRIEQKTR